jgi:hypothetical protein
VFILAPVHAHLLLLGWASLALAGIIYHLYPAAGTTRLARIHFWAHNSPASGPAWSRSARCSRATRRRTGPSASSRIAMLCGPRVLRRERADEREARRLAVRRRATPSAPHNRL